MNDGTLELLIKLGVIGEADAKAARDLLRETTGATGDLSKATDNLGQAHDESGKHAEHSHISHRALHQIMHMIGHETAPELGRALGGALYGQIGLVIALGAAFEFVHKQIEKSREEIAKLAEEEAKLKTDIWAARTEATNKARESLFSYNLALDEMLVKMDKQKALDKQITDDIEAQAKAITHVIEAGEKREKAASKEKEEKDKEAAKMLPSAHAREAANAVAEQQQKEREEEINRRYGARKSEAELTTERTKIADEQFKLDRDTKAQPGLAAASDAAAKALAFTMLDTGPTTELAAAKARQAELDKKAGEFNVPDLQQQYDSAFDPANGFAQSAKDIAAANLEEGRKAVRAAEINRVAVMELTDAVTARTEAIAAEKAVADEAKKKYEDNVKAVESLTNTVEGLKRLYQIHADAMKDTATAGTTTTEAQNIVTAAVAAIVDAKRGKFTQDDRNAIENLKTLLESLGWNATAVIEHLNHSTDLHKASVDEIKAVTKRLLEIQKLLDAKG